LSIPLLPTATLYLAVTDAQGAVPQGNVFVALVNESTGQSWRTLRWHRPSGSFLFPGLPPGQYAYRVWRTPDDAVRGTIELTVPGARRVSARLGGIHPRPRLELPVAGRLEAWRCRIADDLIRGPAEGSGSRPVAPGGAGGVLTELLTDGRVIACVTLPMEALNVPDALKRFIAGRAAGADPVGDRRSQADAARARFAMITLGVADNPRLARMLAPEAGPDEVWAAILRVLSTLDMVYLDEVLTWAAWLHHPRTARLEMFARAWAERFDGLGNLRPGEPRGPRLPGLAPPARPDLPGPVTDEAHARAAAPLLAEVARIVADCTPRSQP
jgi:hypothetical protein